MRVLFVNAHPDDTEFTCAATCLQMVQLGWDVHQLLMTTDEYGTKRDDFKGKRIRAIRKNEMETAAKEYGVDENGKTLITLHWFGEIDGYLPFNRDVYSRLRQKVMELDPDLVIGPDSFFSMDLHPDHKHTGWLIYFVVKSLPEQSRPRLWLYHSFATNHYVPFTDFSIQVEAWSKHRSQTSPFANKVLYPLRKIFYTFRRLRTGPAFAEGFREVTFAPGENKIEKLQHRILYHFVADKMSSLPRERYLPTPEELGLR